MLFIVVWCWGKIDVERDEEGGDRKCREMGFLVCSGKEGAQVPQRHAYGTSVLSKVLIV